jgi:predicted CxxxxCH...CXXCH cytochrome family protein
VDTGASPTTSCSSRSTHSSSTRRSQTLSSIPAWTSPTAANLAGMVAILKSSVSTSDSSSHVTGAETVASARPRTE